MSSKYQYPTNLSIEIEKKVIKDRDTIPRFSLNELINDLLDVHYGIKPDEKKQDALNALIMCRGMLVDSKVMNDDSTPIKHLDSLIKKHQK